MQVQDAYKLLYQGVMGAEHISSNQQEFLHQLEIEFESLSATAGQQLVEPIRVDQALFRFNLRAYKSEHTSIDLLIPYFLDTLLIDYGTKAELIGTWQTFIRICDKDLSEPFPDPEVKQFSQWLEQEDYPAVHHSEVYRREYLPAYRLIAAQFIPLLGVTNAG